MASLLGEKRRLFPWVDVVCPCHEEELTSLDDVLASKSLQYKRSDEEFGGQNQDSPQKHKQLQQQQQFKAQNNSSIIPHSIWDPFSRHKLEFLYFCEFCQSIKCPRCVEEDIVCHYCPVCLFEVTPATARAEGNRCPRNCFKCPKCLTSVNPRPAAGAAAAAAAASISRSSSRVGTRNVSEDERTSTSKINNNTYSLTCTYCSWTSDSSGLSTNGSPGLTFQRGRSLIHQLQAVEGRKQKTVAKRFQDLRSFYFQRSLEEGTRAALVDDGIFGTGRVSKSIQKNQGNVFLRPPQNNTDDLKAMLSARAEKVKSFAEILEQRIQERNQKDTSAETFPEIEEVDESENQREASIIGERVYENFMNYQNATNHLSNTSNTDEMDIDTDPENNHVHITDCTMVDVTAKSFTDVVRDELDTQQNLPVPQPLRAKRTKRCSSCHHILAKPEVKPSSTRFKIKLMALNYLPSLRLNEYPPKTGYPKFLEPNKPHTFLLTITNPMHVEVKVSLATVYRNSSDRYNSNISGPNKNRAGYPHKVTLITPTVTLGADEELWDEESLIKGVPSMFIKRESPLSKRIEVEGHRTFPSSSSSKPGGPNSTASVTGVYQQGKNWSCVPIEVVPSDLASFLEIPLFVNFTFKIPNEENDEEKEKEKGKREDDQTKSEVHQGKRKENDEDETENDDNNNNNDNNNDNTINSNDPQKHKNKKLELEKKINEIQKEPTILSSENNDSNKNKLKKSEPEVMSFGYWAILGVGPIQQR